MKKKKPSEMTRTEMEAELQMNAKVLSDLENQNPNDIRTIEKDLQQIKSKTEQITKLFIDRQTKNDIFTEKLKFYQNLCQSDKKRVRPKNTSFCHSTRTKSDLANTFQSLAEAKNDPRFAISAAILNNQHQDHPEEFEELLKNSKCNMCIMKSLQLRKQIHDNYDQIRQLNETLYTVALPDVDEDDKHLELVQKLTRKLESKREKHIQLLHEHAVYKELQDRFADLQVEVNNLKERKIEVEKEMDRKKKESADNEQHLFEFQVQLAETIKSQLYEIDDELQEKINRLTELSNDIMDQSHEKEEQLNDLRDDFDLINGPFKKILDSCPSDPFDDPHFVALFGESNHSTDNLLPTFSTNTSEATQEQIEDLELQIKIKDEEVEYLKKRINEIQTNAIMSFKIESDTESVENYANHIQFTEELSNTNKTEIVIYAGEFNFTKEVVGHHSVKAKLITKAFGMESSTKTRLSAHVPKFNAYITFIVENNNDLVNYIKNSRGVIEIFAGDDCNDLIGTSKINFSPFLNDTLLFSSNITIRDPFGTKIGTLSIESGTSHPINQ